MESIFYGYPSQFITNTSFVPAMDPSKEIKRISRNVNEAMHQYFPLTKTIKVKQVLPWLVPAIKALMQKRDLLPALHRIVLTASTLSEQYRMAKNQVKHFSMPRNKTICWLFDCIQ